MLTQDKFISEMKMITMKDDFYGMVVNSQLNNEADRVKEEVLINGWSVIKEVFTPDKVAMLSMLIDSTYDLQEKEFGREVLLSCNEGDQARCITRHHIEFFKLAKEPRITACIEALLGSYYTLMLQNAVISRPDVRNHQTSWHRDLPHQNFVSSEPLAVNMLLVIDEFNSSTGATELVPFTHKQSQLPSTQYIDKHKVCFYASPGDVVIFDSMLYHRAGINNSNIIRRAVNTQFSKPFIKPQYELHRIVPESFVTSEEDRRLLGMTSATAIDENDWRRERIRRSKG